MKFHCESCNARYSIPDERVRGKVLKIRCKSCSAVITVREDADPDVLESGEPSGTAAVDVDWYMSIDGEQTGPMKLAIARAWLAKQSPSVDVYCWYDGFGDWKKADEVALFANVRSRGPAARPGAPSSHARASAPRMDALRPRETVGHQGGSTRGTGDIPSPRTPGPGNPGVRAAGSGARPLAASSPIPGASSPAASPGRPSRPAIPAPAPTIVPTLRPSLQSQVQAQAQAQAQARAQVHPAGSVPSASRLSPTPMHTPAPAAAPTPEHAASQPRAKAGHVQRQRPSTTGPTGPMSHEAKGRVPLIAPPSIPPTPLPRPHAAPPGVAGMARPIPGVPPASSTGPTPGPLEPPVRLRTEENADPVAEAPEVPLGSPRSAASSPTLTDDPFAGHDNDLELDIEEPSRVVSLGVLMAQRRHGAAVRGPALPSGQSNASLLAPPEPSGDGDADVEAPLPASSEIPELAPPPPRRRSYLTIVLTVIIVLALGAGALAFMVLGDKDKDKKSVAGGGVSGDFENLGLQVDRPDRRSGQDGDTSGNGKDPGDSATGDQRPTPRTERKNGSSSRRPGDRDGKSKNGGQDENGDTGTDTSGIGTTEATGPEALRPLSPDDVIRQSGRSQISFKRCYERAKKKDPFLEVRSLKIGVKIDPGGSVTNVTLDKMQGSYLGNCIEATVKRWKLPASTKGINTEISLEFER